ncbi:MAG: mechanosensitive ion channel family protein [Blastocatellia bacterium]|nr:mechanosensitive ion channel family protein [Blastocatellia bacterium]
MVIAVVGVCVALHLLISVAQRRLARRFTLPVRTAEESPSLRGLLFAWMGNALRTAVWLGGFAFLIEFLPRTRTQFEGLGERLERVRDQWLTWLVDRGVGLIVIVIVTIFLMRFASALIRTIFALFERSAVQPAEIAARRRLQTLSDIFRGVAQTVIMFIGLMVLLQQMHVNITPILASAGVVGIAIGFGAQSLIRDLFAGLMILLEDQFNIGDSVKIGETAGTVEHLTLRSTRVRALDGALTTIPNGTIATVSNFSRDWSRAVIDTEIDYAEDIDHAMRVLLDTARRLHEERHDEIIEAPTMQGIDKFAGGAVTLRLLVKTQPTKQHEIARELRRRIKLAFETENIKMPSGQSHIVLSGPDRK